MSAVPRNVLRSAENDWTSSVTRAVMLVRAELSAPDRLEGESPAGLQAVTAEAVLLT